MALLSPVSFDGTSLQSGTYTSGFPSPTDGLPPTVGAQWEQPSAKVAGGPYRALASREMEFEFDLDVHLVAGATDAAIQSLKRLFGGRKGERWLVATDGTTQWRSAVRVVSTAFDPTGDLSWYRFRLRAADGRWQSNSAQADSQSVAADDSLAWTTTAGGNDRAPLAVTVTPTAAKGVPHDYSYRRQAVIANRCPRTLEQYPFMVWDDISAELAAGRIQPSGNDLRVFVDAAEVSCWIGGGTSLWIALDLTPARRVTTAAMTAGTPATGADWPTGGTADLPESGVLLIDSEALAWTGKAADGVTLTGITRGVRGTTAATHADGSVGYVVEHQVDVLYGWSAAPVPTPDPDDEPMFRYQLGPSQVNNGVWVYDATSGFATTGGKRPGEWSPDYQLTNDKAFAARGLHAFAASLPTANGGHTNGTATGAASLWQCVDDPAASPDDDATYINYTATGQTSFVPAAPAIPAGSIIGNVAVVVRAKSVSAGADAVIDATLKLGGVEYQSLAVAPAPGHNAYATGDSDTRWDTNPATSQPWRAEEVNAIQEIGLIITGMGAATAVRVTQVYLRVEHAPQADPAAALGIYINPDAPVAGYSTADTWMLPTPAGVKGAGAFAAVLAGGTAAGDAELIGTDLDGETKPLGSNQATIVYGGTEVVTLTPLTTLQAVGVRFNSVATGLFEGIGITAVTVTFDATRVPALSLSPREVVYLHRWTLANAATGQQVAVLWPGALDADLTVDADSKQVSYELPGYNATPALVATTDSAWLELEPGSNGLTWTDGAAGAAGDADIDLAWRDRRT